MENHYQFDLPSQQKSIIKVIGVGGGGSNAVNHMFSLGIIDPFKVTKNAVLNSASVAATILTTSCVISNKRINK